MMVSKKVLITLFVGVLLCVPTSVFAGTIYTNSSTGNDTTGDGSSGSPYKTFHKAYTEASSGDTLDLTGTFDWTNSDETGDVSGTGYTISKSLTIQGQLASTTVIQASSTAYTADRGVFTVSGSGVSVTIQDLTIRYGHNTSDSGAAGIHLTSAASLTLDEVIVTENASNGRFGVSGIRTQSSGALIIRSSTIHENDGVAAYNAGGGSWYGYTGGLQINGSGTVEITNSTFFGNTATYNGGVYQSHSSSVATVTNSTFVGNRGTVTGHNYSLWSGTLYIKNSILADRFNASASDFRIQSGTVYDGGNNIVETQSSSTFTDDENGNMVGDQVSLNIAAALATNSTSNGIPTLALSSGSVAINAGTTTAHNSVSVPSDDARAMTRDAQPDIGAYEYGAESPDNTAPSVSITAPSASATVGGTVTLSASASDDVSVLGVSFYVDGVQVGSEDTSSPYSITWDSLATTSSARSLQAVARDGWNNYATSSAVSVTLSNTPTASAISTTTATTTATVSWTSAYAGSTRFFFGIANALASSTPEANTGSRVTSHSVNLSGLPACTVFRYYTVSETVGGDIATSSESTFTTVGCTGSASVTANGEGVITTASGGTLTQGDVTLTVPTSFTSTTSSATFQALTLDTTAFVASAGAPSGKTRAGSVFRLKAFTDESTTLTSFDSSITVTLSYSDDDVSGLDESSLTIHRYNGSTWNELSSCTVNTSANTVSCTTTAFSDFSIFGDESAAESGSSSSGGGSLPWCSGPLAPGWNRGLPNGGCNTIAHLSQHSLSVDVVIDPPQTQSTQDIKEYVIETSHTNDLLHKPTTTTSTFSRTLRAHMEGEDVRLLQIFLNAHGFPLAETGFGSPGNETDYFGPMTWNALVAFQEAHKEEILLPLGISQGTGIFGERTQAFIHSQW